MKKTSAIAIFLAVAAGTASAGAAITLGGSDTLEVMTKRIISTCTLDLTGVTYGGGGSTVGETNMKNALATPVATPNQQVAPMSRYFGNTSSSAGCLNASVQGTAEGLEIAGDGISIVTSTAGSTQCLGTDPTGGLAKNTTITVQNAPGADTNYTFADWTDVLRVLYSGRTPKVGSPATNPAADCGSNLRKSLQKSWSKLFQASCGATPCTELKHVWRRGDLSGTTDTFIGLTGLPGITKNTAGVVLTTPFCNGKDYEDLDPVRVPCDANDDVCGADGKMGLVQTVFVPEGLPTDVAYPTKACDPGVYDWVPAAGVTLDTCPGGGVNVFTLCLMPAFNDPTQTKLFNHSCVKREANDAPFFTPNTTNTLVFNEYLRKPNGSLVKDAENREISGAFYRMRSRSLTGCRQDTATQQIGCLAAQYGCSLGFAGQESLQVAGTTGLVVNSVTATPATVLNRTYPLARGLYFNTLKGFENVSNTTNELNLAKCFADNTLVNAAASFAGFVPVNAVDATAKIKCIDFNQSVCTGAPANSDSCSNNVAPFPN